MRVLQLTLAYLQCAISNQDRDIQGLILPVPGRSPGRYQLCLTQCHTAGLSL